MFALYKEKRDKIVVSSYTFVAGSVEKQKALDDCSAINKIMDKLKKTSDKNNIFREAHEIFYDPKFDEKMDTNEYLMCFSNKKLLPLVRLNYGASRPGNYGLSQNF